MANTSAIHWATKIITQEWCTAEHSHSIRIAAVFVENAMALGMLHPYRLSNYFQIHHSERLWQFGRITASFWRPRYRS